jgi:hypothetical protein
MIWVRGDEVDPLNLLNDPLKNPSQIGAPEKMLLENQFKDILELYSLISLSRNGINLHS